LLPARFGQDLQGIVWQSLSSFASVSTTSAAYHLKAREVLS
jgi:hypothetical protein